MLVRDAGQEEQGLETENCLHLEQDLIAGPTYPLHALLGGILPSITQHIFLRSYQNMGMPNLAIPIFANFKPGFLRNRMMIRGP
jgi:hypothetical protein